MEEGVEGSPLECFLNLKHITLDNRTLSIQNLKHPFASNIACGLWIVQGKGPLS